MLSDLPRLSSGASATPQGNREHGHPAQGQRPANIQKRLVRGDMLFVRLKPARSIAVGAKPEAVELAASGLFAGSRRQILVGAARDCPAIRRRGMLSLAGGSASSDGVASCDVRPAAYSRQQHGRSKDHPHYGDVLHGRPLAASVVKAAVRVRAARTAGENLTPMLPSEM
jgi:hypothetical protein